MPTVYRISRIRQGISHGGLIIFKSYPNQDTNRGLLQRCSEAEAESGRTGAIVESLQHQQVGAPPSQSFNQKTARKNASWCLRAVPHTLCSCVSLATPQKKTLLLFMCLAAYVAEYDPTLYCLP